MASAGNTWWRLRGIDQVGGRRGDASMGKGCARPVMQRRPAVHHEEYACERAADRCLAGPRRPVRHPCFAPRFGPVLGLLPPNAK